MSDPALGDPATSIDAELALLLSSWLVGTGIALLELRTAKESLRLVRGGAAHGAVAPATLPMPPPSVSSVTIGSPGAGVFRHRHPLHVEVLAASSQVVVPGDVVGVVQVGALLMHVVAPTGGIVAEVLTPDGALVGYGAALLRLDRSVAT